MSDKSQIKELIDNLYYEKLGVIVSKISKWRTGKSDFFNQTFLHSYHQFYTSAKHKEQQIKSQCSVILEILEEFKQCFSKFKANHSPTQKKNGHSIQKEKIFGNAKNKWEEQKNNTKNLYDFSYTFHAVLNKQIEVIHHNCTSLYHLQKKFVELSNQMEGKFANKTHIMSIKHKKKFFELAKLYEILKIYEQEVERCLNLIEQTHKIYEEILKSIKTMFANITINLDDLNSLYQKCFGQKLGKQLPENSKKCQQIIQEELQQFQKNITQINFKLSQGCKKYSKDLEQIIWQTLEEISIASWDIEMKVESHQSKNKEQGQYIPTKGILTMDNKFIIIENEKTIIGEQFSLLDAHIKQLDNKVKDKKSKKQAIKDTKKQNQAYQEGNGSDSDAEIQIKSKKKGERIYIRFESQQRVDQFFLHVNKAKTGKVI